MRQDACSPGAQRLVFGIGFVRKNTHGNLNHLYSKELAMA